MTGFKHFKPYEGNAPYIFISYAHANDDQVLPIVADMHAHGYNIWYDEGIEVGSEWQECIASHLVDAHLVVAFISNAYMASDNCRREMHYALSKRIKVINVFLQETALTPGMEMQIGNIFALMKYTFPDDEVFYQKLYSAPLLLSENFSGGDLGAETGADRAVKSTKADKMLKRALRRAERRKPAAKKKKKKIAVLSVCLAVVGVIVAGLLVAYFTGYMERFLTETKTVVELAGQTEAEFTEPLFEAAAREFCGKSEGKLTVADLRGMTALYVCGDRYWLNEPLVVLLLGVGGATTARVKDWQGNTETVSVGTVSDLSDLKYFTSLRTLHLQFQSISSLDSLPVCGIETLDISGCRVASLMGVSNLPELRSITANGNSLTDLGDLRCCLYLSDACFIGGAVTDYSAFTALNQIVDVSFSNCSARELKQVLDHSSLRKVRLYNCDLSGRFFNMFDNEDAIINLGLVNCSLDNLDGISEFGSLTELTLYGCTGISSYGPLSGMPSLKTVYADSAAAKELAALKAAFSITVIEE